MEPRAKTITIEQLLSSTTADTLSSPRKSNNTLKCAVLTKSPLKEIKKGKMFTMTLCDGNPTSSIRAVCFEEGLYDKFVVTKTYDLKSFKIKQGMSSNSVKVLITDATTVIESLFQFGIEKRSFKVSQIIRRETLNVKVLNVKAKVIAIEDLETVGKYPNQMNKRDIVLGDESGQITFVLWHQRASSIQFKEGEVLNIENAVTSTFNNNVSLTTGSETTITVVSEEMEVPTASATPVKKHSTVTSVETNILALKEFICQYRCVNCRTDIEWLDTNKTGTGDVLVNCPTCSTIFMGDITKVKNHCKLMLSYNNQWFTAGTRVVQHLFDWQSPKRAPTYQDLQNMLRSKFSLRLDLERKMVEHAELVTENSTENKIEPTPAKRFKDNESEEQIEEMLLADESPEEINNKVKAD